MRILYIQYTNPGGYPPLQHSSTILAGAGWHVLFLGSGAQGASELEFPPQSRIRIRRIPFCSAGWRQKLHYVLFNVWTFLWVLFFRPDWVYASDSMACPLAALLTFVPGVRVLYHEHDSPNEGERTGSMFERLVLRMRRLLAKRADLCVLPNRGRAEWFKQRTGTSRPVLDVWNCPSSKDVVEDRLDQESDRLVIFFHGSIVPARLPMTVVEAVAKLPRQVVLRVAGYETIGHSGYVQALKRRAEELGISDRLEFLGSFPQRETLLDHCREANVGLAFMPLHSTDINERAMAGASNKPFDYLACGLALLVSELPEWQKTFVEPGYGLACDPENVDSIASRLLWFVQNPSATRTMGVNGRKRILSEWNYERQFFPVREILETTESL